MQSIGVTFYRELLQKFDMICTNNVALTDGGETHGTISVQFDLHSYMKPNNAAAN
jgi:hypothetical protein